MLITLLKKLLAAIAVRQVSKAAHGLSPSTGHRYRSYMRYHLTRAQALRQGLDSSHEGMSERMT